MINWEKNEEILEETELFINLKYNRNLAESDLRKINTKWELEQQIQNQEMQDSGWQFRDIVNMTIYFYKTQKINGSSYVKIPIRSNTILNIQNDDKYCFIWSILAHLYPSISNPQRVINYKHFFDEFNIEGFDFYKWVYS